MTGFTLEAKRRLGAKLHEVDESDFPGNVVPSITSPEVQIFTGGLSLEPPVTVPRRSDDHAIYNWPADGIREKIAADGGSIRFGWRLQEWPNILLRAEFHAVWVNPTGTMVDITPAVPTGDSSVFVPDPSYPEEFTSDERPPSRYHPLYAPPDRTSEVAERIAALKPSQRAYEERRASKAGKTLEEWMLRKFAPDPLLARIGAHIRVYQAFEAKLATLPAVIAEYESVVADDAVPEAPRDADEASTPRDAIALTADELSDWSWDRMASRHSLLSALQKT